jgi:hypothetical protein
MVSILLSEVVDKKTVKLIHWGGLRGSRALASASSSKDPRRQ